MAEDTPNLNLVREYQMLYDQLRQSRNWTWTSPDAIGVTAALLTVADRLNEIVTLLYERLPQEDDD